MSKASLEHIEENEFLYILKGRPFVGNNHDPYESKKFIGIYDSLDSAKKAGIIWLYQEVCNFKILDFISPEGFKKSANPEGFDSFFSLDDPEVMFSNFEYFKIEKKQYQYQNELLNKHQYKYDGLITYKIKEEIMDKFYDFIGNYDDDFNEIEPVIVKINAISYYKNKILQDIDNIKKSIKKNNNQKE